jgi:hypothetical protein
MRELLRLGSSGLPAERTINPGFIYVQFCTVFILLIGIVSAEGERYSAAIVENQASR